MFCIEVSLQDRKKCKDRNEPYVCSGVSFNPRLVHFIAFEADEVVVFVVRASLVAAEVAQREPVEDANG